jgi:hypothetical protein
MMKKKESLKILMVSLLVLLSTSTVFSQESTNKVFASVNHSVYHRLDTDNLENVPLKWNGGWHTGFNNLEDETHEVVINPKITLKSSLNFCGFYLNDPKVFTHQPAGLYTWDFCGYTLFEYEGCGVNLQEIRDIPMKKPGLTLSRTVFPEVLTDKTTLQKVTVNFRLEEPLLSCEYVDIRIGEFRDLNGRDSLVSLRVVDKTTPEGWSPDSYPFFAFWRKDTASLKIGKTYTFEAIFETVKSDKILGSPIFKPKVYVFLQSDQYRGSEISDSTTIVYSDDLSVTFSVDNTVAWEKYIIDQNYIELLEVLSGIVGKTPPFHVMIDADVTFDPSTFDFAEKGVFTAYIKLPKGYHVSNIDVSTLSCEGAPAVKGTVIGKDKTVYKAEFNIQDLMNVSAGDVILTVTGELTDKTQFEGKNRAKIMNTQLEGHANKKFEEAVTAFNSEDYKTAEKLFTEAEDMYRSISNFGKVSECLNFINQCNQHLEKEQLKADKAETLLNEGVTYFEHQQYDLARTKFEDALTLFTELGDEDQVKECEKWIASSEEKEQKERENGGFCTGSSLIILILLSGTLKDLFEDWFNKRTKK